MKKATAFILSLFLLLIISESCADTVETCKWHKEAFMDEFNQPTENYYIITEPIKGSFSNSVVSNEECTVKVLCTAGWDIGILLKEYGLYDVKNTSKQATIYNLTVLANDGFKFTVKGKMASGDQVIYFTHPLGGDDNSSGIRRALADGGTVRFSLVEQDTPTQKYVFSIDKADGFAVAFETAFNLPGMYSNTQDEEAFVMVRGKKVKAGTVVETKANGRGVVVKVELGDLPYPFQGQDGAFVTIRWDKDGSESSYVLPQMESQLKKIE